MNLPSRPPSRPLDGLSVSHAICRDGLFVIEASTPALRVMLRFCPERQKEGDYEIHPGPDGGAERGRPYKVMAVRQDEKNEPASMLTQFPTRYVVLTTASDRHGRHLAWLVGLTATRDRNYEPDTRTALSDNMKRVAKRLIELESEMPGCVRRRTNPFLRDAVTEKLKKMGFRKRFLQSAEQFNIDCFLSYQPAAET